MFAGFNAEELSNYRQHMAEHVPDVLARIVNYEEIHDAMNESRNPIDNPSEFSRNWFHDLTDYISELL